MPWFNKLPDLKNDPRYLEPRMNELDAQLAHIAYTNVNEHSGTDSEKLNAFLSTHAGKTVRIPRGIYTIDSTINIPENTEVIAYGVKIECTAHITAVNPMSGSIVKGLELTGFGYSTPDSLGRAFEIRGISDTDRKENISIINCIMNDFGYYGVFMEFSNNIDISHCHIENVGYAGIMGLSVKNVIVDRKTKVKNVIGVNGNAYGIAFTRDSVSDDLVTYPRSEDCTVRDCVIEDVSIWEGLDTHAGKNIQFLNNVVRGCKHGIALVGAAGTLSPIECKVSGNKIYGNQTGYGVAVVGANNVLGSPHSYATGNTVENNYIENCGKEAAWDSGILFYITSGTNIIGNTLNKCIRTGININHTNKGFSVVGNTLIDINSSDYGYCIHVKSEYNEGVIQGNNMIKLDGTLTNVVNSRGVRSETMNNNKLSIGVNSYGETTIPLSGVLGNNVDYLTFGTALKLYSSNGSPEGVITAPIGSVCFNYAGGAGTTLYVKESGTGNTGWVAK